MMQEVESYMFTDWPVQVVAIDNTGQLAALPGRGGVALLGLTQSEGISCVGKIARQSKWDCGSIEWNPHSSHQTHLVSTSNKKIELWTWEEGKGRKLQDLRAHTRAVSCLNWSRFDPQMLATCSYDSYTYLWDLRDCKKPRPLSTVSGASHLKWNSTHSHILATTHDGDVRIWDLRRGDSPMSYISAHLSKINGLDWSPIDGNKLITCSLDRTVKLWDVFEDTRNAKALCDHRAPVWRAKYTKGSFYHRIKISAEGPLSGATCAGDEHFQLLTWSRDQMLKIWNLDRRCWQLSTPQDGREERALVSPDASEFFPVNDDNIVQDSDSGESLMLRAAGKPDNLEDEITHAYNAVASVVWEEVDITNRRCKISVKSGNHNLKMSITFPELYPNNAVPSFEVTEDSPVDSSTKVKIREILRETAQSRFKNNERCLERCLKCLIAYLEELKVHDFSMIHPPLHSYVSGYSTGVIDSSSYSQDAATPFPQTSGATFCANGLLVCFNRSTRLSSRRMELTPRSLSALPAYSSRTLSSFYTAESLKTGIKSNSSSRKALVILRDASSLMAFNRSLAQNYTIFGCEDPTEICEKNKKAAIMAGRADLVQTWSLLGLMMNPELAPSKSASEVPWASHPFGKKLLMSLLKYYTEIYDIQTLAMISCLLKYQTPPESFGDNFFSSSIEKSNRNDYVDQRIAKNFNLLEEESPNFEEAVPGESISPAFTIINFPAEEERRRHEKNCRFVEKEKQRLFDHYKLCYADLLYKCEFRNRRNEVLKFVSSPPTYIRDKDFLLKCPSCHDHYSDSHCQNCNQIVFRCVICRTAVKGAFNLCLSCGHGGHALHILKWFDSKGMCPTGCGCLCLTQGFIVDDTF